MATTSGLVLSLTWVANVVCAQVGAPGAAEMLIVSFGAADPPEVLSSNRSMVKLLARAQGADYPVLVTHGDSDAIVASVQLSGFDICRHAQSSTTSSPYLAAAWSVIPWWNSMGRLTW